MTLVQASVAANRMSSTSSGGSCSASANAPSTCRTTATFSARAGRLSRTSLACVGGAAAACGAHDALESPLVRSL